MGKFKTLAGETVIYGGGTILVRLLNWLLMPYYIRHMDVAQFGLVTNVYSYIAVFLVILTYGFETTFFRFAKKDNESTIFSTAIFSIFSTSIIFFLFVQFASSYWFENDYDKIIKIAAAVVSIDAVTSLVFAKLRFDNQSIKFALLKLLNVFFIIGFNIFFLRVCPVIMAKYSQDHLFYRIVLSFYQDNHEAYYVFLSNLFASIVILISCIKPTVLSLKQPDFKVLKRMYKYTLPILIVGIAGSLNQNVDKIIFPYLLGEEEGLRQLGIYGANFKIGILMALFTQAFRMAFEPFFFKHHNSTNDTSIYNQILIYFSLFGMLVFLGVTFFIDVVNLFLTSDYIEGNVVIPIVLFAQLLSGIYFTLSVWYKISDNTKYGAIMGVSGSLLTITSNFILIPKFGYIGAAISSLLGFTLMVLLSIILGKKYFPIYYNWSKLTKYLFLTLFLFIIGYYIVPRLVWFNSSLCNDILQYSLRIGLLIVFLLIAYFIEYKNQKKYNVNHC